MMSDDVLSDRDIAIRYLAIDELGPGEDPDRMIDHYDQNIDYWMGSEHSGDCTKQSWSCCRCTAERAYAMVPALRKMFEI